MYWAIGYVLKNFLNGRELVVLGDGINAMTWSVEIKKCASISKTITIKDIKNIEPSSQYVVICEDSYNDSGTVLQKMGFCDINDYYDWTRFDRTKGHLPIDVNYNSVRIGMGSYFPFAKTTFKHLTSIGRFCSISNSAIIQGNHSMNRITTSSLYPIFEEDAKQIKDTSVTDKDPRCTGAKLKIGNDVWIGANVFINASKVASIGDGAILGTNALVLDDVPPFSVVYGSPAKVKRYRFSPEQIDILLKISWWNWDKEKINNNIKLLMNPELFFNTFK